MVEGLSESSKREQTELGENKQLDNNGFVVVCSKYIIIELFLSYFHRIRHLMSSTFIIT